MACAFQISDDRYCACYDETNYIGLICELPVWNLCYTYENNEETIDCMIGRSVGYCSACHKPEPKAKENKSNGKKTFKQNKAKNFDVTDYATGR